MNNVYRYYPVEENSIVVCQSIGGKINSKQDKRSDLQFDLKLIIFSGWLNYDPKQILHEIVIGNSYKVCISMIHLDLDV